MTITLEDKINLSYANAAIALRRTLDALNHEGITIGAYEMMCMFNRQSFTAEKQAAFAEALALHDMLVFFHSREQIVVMRKPENQCHPRMMTTEFETYVREARSDQTAQAQLDSRAATAVS